MHRRWTGPQTTIQKVLKYSWRLQLCFTAKKIWGRTDCTHSSPGGGRGTPVLTIPGPCMELNRHQQQSWTGLGSSLSLLKTSRLPGWSWWHTTRNPLSHSTTLSTAANCKCCSVHQNATPVGNTITGPRSVDLNQQAQKRLTWRSSSLQHPDVNVDTC